LLGGSEYLKGLREGMRCPAPPPKKMLPPKIGEKQSLRLW